MSSEFTKRDSALSGPLSAGRARWATSLSLANQFNFNEIIANDDDNDDIEFVIDAMNEVVLNDSISDSTTNENI